MALQTERAIELAVHDVIDRSAYDSFSAQLKDALDKFMSDDRDVVVKKKRIVKSRAHSLASLDRDEQEYLVGVFTEFEICFTEVNRWTDSDPMLSLMLRRAMGMVGGGFNMLYIGNDPWSLYGYTGDISWYRPVYDAFSSYCYEIQRDALAVKCRVHTNATAAKQVKMSAFADFCRKMLDNVRIEIVDNVIKDVMLVDHVSVYMPFDELARVCWLTGCDKVVGVVPFHLEVLTVGIYKSRWHTIIREGNKVHVTDRMDAMRSATYTLDEYCCFGYTQVIDFGDVKYVIERGETVEGFMTYQMFRVEESCPGSMLTHPLWLEEHKGKLVISALFEGEKVKRVCMVKKRVFEDLELFARQQGAKLTYENVYSTLFGWNGRCISKTGNIEIQRDYTAYEMELIAMVVFFRSFRDNYTSMKAMAAGMIGVSIMSALYGMIPDNPCMWVMDALKRMCVRLMDDDFEIWDPVACVEVQTYIDHCASGLDVLLCKVPQVACGGTILGAIKKTYFRENEEVNELAETMNLANGCLINLSVPTEENVQIQVPVASSAVDEHMVPMYEDVAFHLQRGIDQCYPGTTAYEYLESLQSVVSPLNISTDGTFSMGQQRSVVLYDERVMSNVRTNAPQHFVPNVQMAMRALLKRNFGTNINEPMSDWEQNFLEIFGVLKEYGAVPEYDSLLLQYRDEPIMPDTDVLADWMCRVDKSRLSAVRGAQVKDLLAMDLTHAGLMFKDNPKVKTEASTLFDFVPVQTIVHYPKEVNAILSPMFTIAMMRLQRLLRPNILFYNRMDRKDLETFVSTYGYDPGMSANYIEGDTSKMDKNQYAREFYYVMRLYIELGFHELLLLTWFDAKSFTIAHCVSMMIAVYVDYQQRSGGSDTLSSNSILDLLSFFKTHKPKIYDMLIYVGDDYLLMSRCILAYIYRDLEAIYLDEFNMEVKCFSSRVPYFCSSFLVSDDGVVVMFPDPVRFLIKIGRSKSADLDLNEYYQSYVNDFKCYVTTEKRLFKLQVLVHRKYNLKVNFMPIFYCYASMVRSKSVFLSAFSDKITLYSA